MAPEGIATVAWRAGAGGNFYGRYSARSKEPSMNPVTGRALPLAAASILLTCMAAPSHAQCWEGVRLISQVDAPAVEVDFVAVFTIEMERRLRGLTAAQYFEQRSAIENDYGSALRTTHVDIPPGTRVDTEVQSCRTVGIFAFANYPTKGDHRIELREIRRRDAPCRPRRFLRAALNRRVSDPGHPTALCAPHS